MPKLKIDGIEVEVPPGTTVLQACEMLGIEVPRFCFHERLEIAGNCRMCLVEQEKAPKPIASCAMPAADNMVIHTNSPRARKARQGVMEFLLINHPLDCPICDQGGECDLQDQAMAYGFDRGRYRENKRAVKDKELGPLVKTTMTRCIHCTRCIRFATEIAGVEELGATGRGENMEVGTYIEHALTSELSGNIIDLCPVGALTSKPYAFTARSWELRKTESVDVLDAVGSNIRIDARGPQVMRILPRLNEAVNEEWISDKTRFAYDGLLRQRLDHPYVRRDGKLAPATWDEAFQVIAQRMKGLAGGRMAAIAGDLACVESMFALRTMMDGVGSPHRDCRQDGAAIDPSARSGYLFNTTIAGIEDADFCLLIGTDPRWEAPLVNARLRKRWRRGGFSVARIGPRSELTYAVEELGNDPSLLAAIADGSHPIAQRLRDAKAPMLILGQGAIARPDGAAVLAAARRVADSCGLVRDGWNGFNLLHTAAARVGGLDVGFVPASGGRDMAGILAGAAAGEIDLVWLLGADEFDMARLGRAFVVYQGHHGDAGAHRADVILPGAAYTEKDALYVNMEGRVQEGRRAVFPPGEAREDWKILRAFSGALGRPLPFDTLDELRRKIAAACPVLATRDAVTAAPWALFGVAGTVSGAPFVPPVADFYMTDPICRASTTMAECSQLYVRGTDARTGTHG
ncbi:NADH-quinone oxidoreductase subunit G [Stella humosa]|uniref:NADH-quinone oxidoreductase n=1 Tax=Stella humosa TaxID=94 RepID=A0A3N1MEV1_9PROT|nr:NADH-quinone oxidoreductase subunit NuoG [Stella humosa]ROQ01685.1 NADH-quinone oxidoreductase subunit G [Stella humosa]BBK32066.1 NADH-quinone oxidoreductase [Stella humosa]